VYFGKDGEQLVILLGGGTKKRQESDIKTAQTLWHEYKRTKGGGGTMANTRRFSETVKADLEKNVEFRRALLSEAVACMVSGDLETGKVVLREYVNGTVGFLELGSDLGRSPNSLMRMLSPAGNPQARNLFEMVAYLQKIEGTVLEVRPSKRVAA
jgi:DNA-binding phage protein